MQRSSSQKEHIYDFISEQISTGALKMSDKLTEQYIAEGLNISRTPVREALFQLAADGILEHTPRKGFRVRKLSQEDARNIYQVIGLLDAKAAVLAMDQLTEEDKSNMQFFIDAMNSAIENELYIKYNELQHQFHNVYVERCGNQTLVECLEKYKRFFLGNVYWNIESEKIQKVLCQTNEEHQQILQMLQEGEKAALRDFIENTHWGAENAQYDNW